MARLSDAELAAMFLKERSPYHEEALEQENVLDDGPCLTLLMLSQGGKFYHSGMHLLILYPTYLLDTLLPCVIPHSRVLSKVMFAINIFK